jgi:hypothetical protein
MARNIGRQCTVVVLGAPTAMGYALAQRLGIASSQAGTRKGGSS